MLYTNTNSRCECGSARFRLTTFDSDDSHLTGEMKFREPGHKATASTWDGNHRIRALALTCQECGKERNL